MKDVEKPPRSARPARTVKYYLVCFFSVMIAIMILMSGIVLASIQKVVTSQQEEYVHYVTNRTIATRSKRSLCVGRCFEQLYL